MKLFRMAFWLGVVIYNLPSSASKSTGPESQHGSQGLSAKAASHFCLPPLDPCARAVEALTKRDEPDGQNSSRDAVKPSQDTLTPADRAVPWRGLAQHKGARNFQPNSLRNGTENFQKPSRKNFSTNRKFLARDASI